MHNDDFYDNNNLPMADQGAMLAEATPYGREFKPKEPEEKLNDAEKLLDLMYQWSFSEGVTHLRRKALEALASQMETDGSAIAVAGAFQIRCGFHHQDRVRKEGLYKKAAVEARGSDVDCDDDEEEADWEKPKSKPKRKIPAKKSDHYETLEAKTRRSAEVQTVEQTISRMVRAGGNVDISKIINNVSPDLVHELSKKMLKYQEDTLREKILGNFASGRVHTIKR